MKPIINAIDNYLQVCFSQNFNMYMLITETELEIELRHLFNKLFL